jgi:hypothetical protein
VKVHDAVPPSPGFFSAFSIFNKKWNRLKFLLHLYLVLSCIALHYRHVFVFCLNKYFTIQYNTISLFSIRHIAVRFEENLFKKNGTIVGKRICKYFNWRW